MQKKHSSGFRSSLLLTLFSFLLTTLLFVACKNGDKGKTNEGSNPAAANVKIKCLKLTYDQLKVWADSGWLNPADPNRAKKLLLQFYSPEVKQVKNNLQLIAYPGKNFNNVKIKGETILAPDDGCGETTFTGKKIFGNNQVNINKLKIVNTDGTLKDFDYILFTPKTYSADERYIVFDWEVIGKKGEKLVSGDHSWPCPPYCDEEESSD